MGDAVNTITAWQLISGKLKTRTRPRRVGGGTNGLGLPSCTRTGNRRHILQDISEVDIIERVGMIGPEHAVPPPS